MPQSVGTFAFAIIIAVGVASSFSTLAGASESTFSVSSHQRTEVVGADDQSPLVESVDGELEARDKAEKDCEDNDEDVDCENSDDDADADDDAYVQVDEIAERRLRLYSSLSSPTTQQKPLLAFDLGNEVWLTPLVTPAVTPELGFMVAVGGMISWKADKISPRSSFPFMVGVGTIGAITANGKFVSYWFEDHLRIDMDLWLRGMNDQYFGVGYDSGKNTPESPTTTAYKRLYTQIAPVILGKLFDNFYVGGKIDFNRSRAQDLNDYLEGDASISGDNSDIRNMGLGAVLRYDSRDFPQNAYKGSYAQASAMVYATALGGQRDYGIFELDLRHYQPVVYPGSLVAFEFKVRHGVGDVPWGEMSMVGSPFDLRGYRWGRYRDKTAMYGIVEYRHRFLTETGYSPHGLVLWAALGTLGDDFSALSSLLPNVGMGYRFAVQDRLNVRLDIGFGDDTAAFYFSFGEAF